MLRNVAGIVAALVAWVLIVTVLNFGLRLWLPGYVEAEPGMGFTLSMKIARLGIAALTSIAAGALVHGIAPRSRWAPWIVGLVLLTLFVPEHIHLWNRFPVWYHLTFLVTLAPLVALGARLGSFAKTAPAVSSAAPSRYQTDPAPRQ
jgi:hypothetical protein